MFVLHCLSLFAINVLKDLKGDKMVKYNNKESSDIGTIPSDAVRNQTSGITCATADTRCGHSHEEKSMTC